MTRVFFAFFIFLYFNAPAQNVRVTFSEHFSLRDRGMSEKDGSTLQRGEYFYCLETVYKSLQFAYTAKLDKIKYGLNVYKYDGNMKEIGEGKLQSGDKSFGPFQPIITFFAGRILIFYYHAQEDYSIQLLYSTVDPESLAVSAGKTIYTISEKNVGFFKLETAVMSNRIKLSLSPDSSRLMVSQSGNSNELFSCVLKPDLSVEKAVETKIQANMEEFAVLDVRLDGSGNRYFTCVYTDGKARKSGVLIYNSDAKEKFLSFGEAAEGDGAGALSLVLSKQDGKAFLFGASSMWHLEAGVIEASLDASGLKLGTPVVCPFSAELKDRLKKMDYTRKRDGPDIEREIWYTGYLLEDGTLAVMGVPIHRFSYTTSSGVNVMKQYAGPVIQVFFHDGQSRVGVIYRNQAASEAAAPIGIPYGNKLICIYNDTEKAIGSDDPHINDKVKDVDELVLAVAVFGNDGTILSKKELAGKAGGPNFFTGYVQQLSGKEYLIPMARDKVNLARYYTELEQWATVHIE